MSRQAERNASADVGASVLGLAGRGPHVWHRCKCGRAIPLQVSRCSARTCPEFAPIWGRDTRRRLSSGAIAIEFAFNRPQLSRRMPKRPTDCIGFRATWVGPDAATRPTRFWSCARGLWTGGRIYPVASLSSL